MSRHPRSAAAAAAAAAAMLFAACTTVESTPRDPLDAHEWRSTKSRLYVDLAMQCLRAEDHARARRLLQQAVQFDATDAATLELLARLAYTHGDLETAGRAAAQLQRLDPASIEALCTFGAVAEARGESAAAESFYRRALALGGRTLRPGIGLHRLLLQQARDGEAAELREQLSQQNGGAIEARLDHGAHLAAAGSWLAAADAYDGALAARPDDAAAATGYALSAVMGRRPAAALALGDRLSPHSRGDNPALALTLAVAHLQAGDCAAALRELDAAAAVQGSTPLHLLRGEVLLQLQRPESALAEFERAAAADPAAVRAHAGLGRLHLAAGRPHAAARAFERVVSLQPDHGPAHAMLAAALANGGDLEAAARHVAIARRHPEAAPLVAELTKLYPGLAPAEQRR